MSVGERERERKRREKNLCCDMQVVNILYTILLLKLYYIYINIYI